VINTLLIFVVALVGITLLVGLAKGVLILIATTFSASKIGGARRLYVPMSLNSEICFINNGLLHLGTVIDSQPDRVSVTCKFSDNYKVFKNNCYNIKVWDLCHGNPIMESAFIRSEGNK
jgi:hypothetical protein